MGNSTVKEFIFIVDFFSKPQTEYDFHKLLLNLLLITRAHTCTKYITNINFSKDLFFKYEKQKLGVEFLLHFCCNCKFSKSFHRRVLNNFANNMQKDVFFKFTLQLSN